MLSEMLLTIVKLHPSLKSRAEGLEMRQDFFEPPIIIYQSKPGSELCNICGNRGIIDGPNFLFSWMQSFFVYLVAKVIDSRLEEFTFTEFSFKVTVNVFWVKISIFQFRHILLAELSRHTMIPCLKLTEVSKMEETSCKRRFHECSIKVVIWGLQDPYLNA